MENEFILRLAHSVESCYDCYHYRSCNIRKIKKLTTAAAATCFKFKCVHKLVLIVKKTGEIKLTRIEGTSIVERDDVSFQQSFDRTIDLLRFLKNNSHKLKT